MNVPRHHSARTSQNTRQEQKGYGAYSERSRPAGAYAAPEPESLAQLRSDCGRMMPRWPAALPSAGSPGSSGLPRLAYAAPEAGRGLGERVPQGWARRLEGMSEFGD